MMTDFAVRVKNLPPLKEYETLDQLKAHLTMHINKVVAKQPSVYGEQNTEIRPEEVVSISFAHKNFVKYNYLMQI
jgi:hypothetical protein